jgi:hypothetical protein|nr:hypothetical protein [uncultured Rhodopila sp.]
MSNPLKIAPPPPRRAVVESEPAPEPELVPHGPEPAKARAPKVSPAAVSKFRQVKEDERVQFNKRVTRGVADGFEMLAIRSRRKVPELLAEALELLEERYGRI